MILALLFIASSNILDTLPDVTTSTRGIMIAADKLKLNGIQAGATASPLTTKGDLWGFTTVNARVPVGSDGYQLVADSSQASGVKWQAVTTYTAGTGLTLTGNVFALAAGAALANLADGSVTDAKLASVFVKGPASSVNQEIATFNGTTGALIADSGVSIAYVPTASEAAALAGTSGTPGSANKYVTDADARNTNSRSPTAHAATHQNGGGDEVATTTAAANAIPKAGAGGTLAIGWIPTGSTSSTVTIGNDSRLSDSRTPTGAAGGDLSGTYPNPTVATVGTSTASNVHSGEQLANAATDANTANTIVKRDASGNFTAGTITAALTGTASGNLTSSSTLDGANLSAGSVANGALANTAVANLSGTNSGDISLGTFGTAPNAKGATLSGQVLTLQPCDATHPGEAPSGGSTSTFLRGDCTWTTPSDTGITQLTGDGTAGPGSGSQALTVTKTNGVAFTNSATTANDTANTASTLVARDSSGNFSAGTITASLTGTASGNLTSSSTLNGANLSAASVQNSALANGAVANLSGTNTGDITLGTFGSSPNAKGASLSGQALTLQPFDATHPGEVPSGGSSSTFLRGDATWVANASAATASTLMLRDSNANVQANNFTPNWHTAATAATTTTLTVTSAQYQYFTGSTASQVVQLPDETTLAQAGYFFVIENNSTQTVTVKDAGSTTLLAMPTLTRATFTATSIATASAGWDAAWTYTSAAATNTANTAVARDGSGNFSAGTITAALTGTASGNLTSASTLNGANLSAASVANSALANGAVANLSGTNSGDVTIATFGSSPTANGATISGQAITLQPFDATHPGHVPSGGNTSTFLRGDATWVTPTDTGITALTGDVTASGSGSQAATIAAAAVTSSKLANNAAGANLGTSTADVSVNSHKLTNVSDPTSSQDADTKNWTDGIGWRAPVLACTTAALAANTFTNNGGVGDLITANGPGAIGTIDGNTLSATNRLLVKDEGTASHNGIYTLTTVGDGTHPFVLTRATDMDEASERILGAQVLCAAGTSNGGVTYEFLGTSTNLFAASVKPLTSAHVFVGNSSNVSTDVALSGDCSMANTGAITCTKTNNVAFANSATTTAASANTASDIVLRDGSGNFSAGTVTATLSGVVLTPFSGALTAAANDAQSGALALTSNVNRVTTSTSTNNSTTLPTAGSGSSSVAEVVIIEVTNVANAVHVFPASGQTINGQSANTEWSAGIPPAGASSLLNSLTCITSSATNWDCTLAVAAPGHQSGSLTNGAANAGEVGEVIRNTLAYSSAVGLSTGTSCNVGATTCPATGGTESITLTAGDWSCQGMVGFKAGGATSITVMAASISKTTNTLSGTGTYFLPSNAEVRVEWDPVASAQVLSNGSVIGLTIPPYQVLVAAGTTQQLFLVAQAVFTASTLADFGSIECRRAR